MLGDKIKKIRISKGYAQKYLAQIVGLDSSTLCKIELNKAKPSLTTLEKLATALGVRVSDLLEEQAS